MTNYLTQTYSNLMTKELAEWLETKPLDIQLRTLLSALSNPSNPISKEQKILFQKFRTQLQELSKIKGPTHERIKYVKYLSRKRNMEIFLDSTQKITLL